MDAMSTAVSQSFFHANNDLLCDLFFFVLVASGKRVSIFQGWGLVKGGFTTSKTVQWIVTTSDRLIHTYIHLSILYLYHLSIKARRKAEAREAGYTPGKSPIYCWANIEKNSRSHSHSPLWAWVTSWPNLHFFWIVGGNWSTRRKPK